MIKLRDLINEATVENETNLPFKVKGIKNNDLIISGKTMDIILSFKGDDLINAISGGPRKGKVVMASVKLHKQ